MKTVTVFGQQYSIPEGIVKVHGYKGTEIDISQYVILENEVDRATRQDLVYHLGSRGYFEWVYGYTGWRPSQAYVQRALFFRKKEKPFFLPTRKNKPRKPCLP